jgi:hypothetical protein
MADKVAQATFLEQLTTGVEVVVAQLSHQSTLVTVVSAAVAAPTRGPQELVLVAQAV